MENAAARHRETPVQTPPGVVKRLFNTSVERTQNGDIEWATLSASFNIDMAAKLRETLWWHIYNADTFDRQEMVDGRKQWVEFAPTIKERTKALLLLPQAKPIAAVVGFYCELMKRGHVLCEMSSSKIAKRTGVSKPLVDRAQRWLKHAGYLTSNGRVAIWQIDGVNHARNRSSLRALTSKAIDELRLGFVLKTAQQRFERGRVTVAQELWGKVHLWTKDYSAPRDPLQEAEDVEKLMKNSMSSVTDVAQVMLMDGVEKRPADQRDRVRLLNHANYDCPCAHEHGKLIAKMKRGDLEAARTLVRHHKEVRDKLPREWVAAILSRADDPPDPDTIPH